MGVQMRPTDAALVHVEAKRFEEEHPALVNAARKHGMESPLTRARSRYKDIDVFSHETEPKELSALDQGHTGRCWAFAGLNLMRRVLCTRLELHDDLVLSQSYFMFYDKFEKARYALDCAMVWDRERRGRRFRDWGERAVDHLMEHCMSDGGHWSMFANVVRKYGVVPEQFMGETRDSSDSYATNVILNKIVRRAFRRIRASELRVDQRYTYIRAMRDVFKVLCTCIGTPPFRATWTYKKKAGDGYEVMQTEITPFTLLEHCRAMLEHEVLCHFPGYTDPGTSYRVELSSNMMGVDPVYHAVREDELTNACRDSLLSGHAVWIGVDWTESDGFLDRSLDYGILCSDLPMTKEESVRCKDATPNHSMILTGVHLVNETPVRWKVENSHGKVDDRDHLTMTHAWFLRYVYTAAVAPSGRFRTTAKVKPPWSVLSVLMT